jgi:hypothetical protein
MTKPSQFLTFLHDRTSARRMDADELAYEMELGAPVVQEWLNGWQLPKPGQLVPLAQALGADPLDVALGWLIEQAPELEVALYDGVLAPRGTKFPHSSDLALRGPKQRPVVECMNVGDPHDL